MAASVSLSLESKAQGCGDWISFVPKPVSLELLGLQHFLSFSFFFFFFLNYHCFSWQWESQC